MKKLEYTRRTRRPYRALSQIYNLNILRFGWGDQGIIIIPKSQDLQVSVKDPLKDPRIKLP